MWNRSIVNLFTASALSLSLGACNLDGDGDGEGDPPVPLLTADEGGPTSTFSIGGTVAGSAGPIALQNSNGTILIVATDGSFTFDTPMVSSAIYNVTVAVAPGFQTCRVANGTGTVALANISNVTVTCTPNSYTARNTPASDFL